MGCFQGGCGFLLGETSQERKKDEEFLKTKEPLIQVVHLALRGQKKRKSKKPGRKFAQEIVTSLENQIVQNAAQDRGEQFEIGILVGFWYPKRNERIIPDEKARKQNGGTPPVDVEDDPAGDDDGAGADNTDKETTPYEVILKVSSSVDSQTRFVKCGRNVINSKDQQGTLFWAIWTRYSSEIKFSVLFVARLGGKGESRMLQESNFGYDFVVNIVQLKKKVGRERRNVLDDPSANATLVKLGERESDDRIIRTFCYLNWKPSRFLDERNPYFVEARRAVDHIGRVYRCKRLVDFGASWNLVSDPVSCCERACYLRPGSHMLQFDNTVLVHKSRISKPRPGMAGSDTPVLEFANFRGPHTPFEGESRRLRAPLAKKTSGSPLADIVDRTPEDSDNDESSVVQAFRLQSKDEREDDSEDGSDSPDDAVDRVWVATDGDIGE